MDQYSWLYKEPGPKMLLEMLALRGISEFKGAKNNPAILAWASELGIDWYTADSIPWCGLAMAIAANRAGYKPPDDPLWALNWKKFGKPVTRPMLGDVMIKNRDGGGHVTMYVGEDKKYYHGLGGNQDDKTNIALFPKYLPSGQIWAFRRPNFRIGQPLNVRIVNLTNEGTVAQSEA